MKTGISKAGQEQGKPALFCAVVFRETSESKRIILEQWTYRFSSYFKEFGRKILEFA